MKPKLFKFVDSVKEVKVGDVVWLASRHYGAHEVVVTGVGRKLIAVSYSAEGKPIGFFYIETGRLKSIYSSSSFLYSSVEAFNKERIQSQVIEKIRAHFSGYGRVEMNYDQAMKIAEILGIDTRIAHEP